MKHNLAVTDTDPGPQQGALNKINEIPELKSFAIQCDQADSRALVIQTVKTSTGDHITVGQAEQSTDNDKVGVYYYIAVTPRNGNPELLNLFQDTYWDCVDFFVLRTKIPVLEERRTSPPVRMFNFNEHTIPIPMPERPGSIEFCSSGNEMGLQPAICPRSLFSGGEMCPEPNTTSYKSVPVEPAICPMDITDSTFTQTNESIARCDFLHTSFPTTTAANSAQLINDSLASKMTSGRRINVQSKQTGFSYVYSVPTNRDGHLVAISLSVCPLNLLPPMPDAELIEAGKILIPELIAKGYAALLKDITIFPNDECVICLDKDLAVDTVFYQCGHQCCHNSCINSYVTKCPLCRKHITASIRI